MEKGQLELRNDGASGAHYLNGRRVLDGDWLEVLLADGTWLRGTYYWPGNPMRWPALRFSLSQPAAGTRRLRAVMSVPPDASFRWAAAQQSPGIQVATAP